MRRAGYSRSLKSKHVCLSTGVSSSIMLKTINYIVTEASKYIRGHNNFPTVSHIRFRYPDTPKCMPWGIQVLLQIFALYLRSTATHRGPSREVCLRLPRSWSERNERRREAGKEGEKSKRSARNSLKNFAGRSARGISNKRRKNVMTKV